MWNRSIGIEGLDLIDLKVCENDKIIDVSFMKNLEWLDASRECWKTFKKS